MPESFEDTSPHILVVDDDERLRDLLERYLRDHDMFVLTAKDAAEARKFLDLLHFDLVILDVMMPGESGMQLAPDIHHHYKAPILMLTAMGEAEQRVEGLQAGVDDYLVKPFEPQELILRIQAILRRTGVFQPEAAAVVQFGEFSFDVERQMLLHNGAVVHLTTAEQELLSVLAKQSGEPVSREVLSQQGYVSERAVDVQINRLRRKLEANPKQPVYVQTVRGKGYVLRVAT